MKQVLIILVCLLLQLLVARVFGDLMLKGNLFGYRNFSSSSTEKMDFSFNFIYALLFPSIFLLMCCMVLKYMHIESPMLWVIVPLYYAIRDLIIIIDGKWCFVTVWRDVFCIVFGTILSYGIVSFFKLYWNRIDPVGALIDNLWIAVFAFIYAVIKSLASSVATVDTEKKNALYMGISYAKHKDKYDDVIKKVLGEEYDRLSPIVYAIIVAEDYNRPKFTRAIEYFVFIVTPVRKTMSLGVMQFRTNKFITSKESVIQGTKKVLEKYKETYDFNEIVCDYNSDENYADTISDIIYKLFPLYSTDTFSIEIDDYKENGYSESSITLIEARKKAGLTQAEMSDLFGIPKKEIAEWERGISTYPAWVEQLIIEKLEEESFEEDY